jgi:hypothetical protein
MTKPKRVWPFPKWYPMLAGMLVGLALRAAFNGQSEDDILSPMNFAFISCAPFAVGAVTVYFAERTARRSWGYYAMVGMGANMFFVIGTMLVLLEGLICAVIIFPMFALYGALGALLMGALCRATNWPKPAACGFAVLPFVFAAIVPSGAAETWIGTSERTVLVQAAPPAVWHQLLHTSRIAPSELDRAWLYRIGVPLPESGLTRVVGSTLERDITMGKAIHFTQVATDWRANSYVKWQYRFGADSFPPKALDDHVRIGGKYFDLINTVYTLTPKGNATELTISMTYRVSTEFNWYAKRVAGLLFSNFEEVILDFYAQRAQRPKLA